MRSILLSLLALSLLPACGELVGDIKSPNEDATDRQVAKVSGKLVLSERLGGGAMADAAVFVEEHEEVVTSSGSNGDFLLEIPFKSKDSRLSGISQASNVSPGIYAVQANGHHEGVVVGARIENLDLKAGAVIDLGNVVLDEYGIVRGEVLLHEKGSHEGIRVSIPGTGYVGTTDSDGIFEIRDVLRGSYDSILYEKEGYGPFEGGKFTVAPGQVTALPKAILFLSTGVQGVIEFAAPDGIDCTLTPKLNLFYSNDAALMKVVSNVDDFDTTAWKPVKRTATVEFAAPGVQTAYVLFADANALTSPILSKDVTIDLDSCGRGRWVPIDMTNGTPPPPSTTFHLFGSAGNHLCVWRLDSNSAPEEGYCFDTLTETWGEMALPTTPPWEASFSFNGQICSWGGIDADDIEYNTGTCYDPSSNSWTDMAVDANTPSPRTSTLRTLTPTGFCVLGGWKRFGNDYTWFSDGGCYSFSTQSWRKIPEHSEFAASFFSIEEEVCSWGEFDEIGDFSAGGACYRFGELNWTPMASDNGPLEPENTFLHFPDEENGEEIFWMGDFSKAYSRADHSWRTITHTDAPPVPRWPAVQKVGREACVYTAFPFPCYDIEANQWTTATSRGFPSNLKTFTALDDRICGWDETEGACWLPE